MRHEDWPARLAAYLEEARNRPFEWGQHDCLTFAFRGYEALTGKTITDAWVGKYSTQWEARALMRQYGLTKFEQVGQKILGRPLMSKFVNRGDIVWTGKQYGLVDMAAVAVAGVEGLRWVKLSGDMPRWETK